MALVWFLAGIFFAIAGVRSFKRAHTTVNPMQPNSASSLVTSGIYRHTRNPMYVGMVAVLISWACLLLSPLSLLGVIGFAVYLQRFQIEPEERTMLALFAEDYSQYQQRVRRWI